MSAANTSRRVAFETIRAVNESDAYANLLLPKAIARAALDTADAGLATELTYGTLRRQGTYDAVIQIAADRPVQEIDPAVLDALRLGTHQLLSTRVASHAAVNESVELARSAGSRGAAGFANAVLRRISRDTPGEWIERVAASARSDDERLGLVFSHPVWIVRAFRRALAAEGRADELEALLTADNASPRVTMAALPGLAEVPDGARHTPYSPFGFRLGGGDPEGLVRESGGRLRVQDEGSQLAALALTQSAAGATGGALARPLCRAGRQDRGARGRGAAARRPTRGQRDLVRARGTGPPGHRGSSPRGARVGGGRPRSGPPRAATTASWWTRRARASERCADGRKRAGASRRRTCPS